MTDAPASKVVIDFDRDGSPLATTQRRCDYLVVTECENGNGQVLVIEMKKGAFKTKVLLEQLQAGAVVAERLVSNRRAARIHFQPVAVVGRVDQSQIERMRRAAGIRFHGKTTKVRTLSCGSSLFVELRS